MYLSQKTEKEMSKTLWIKTPLGMLEMVWVNGALTQKEDVEEAKVEALLETDFTESEKQQLDHLVLKLYQIDHKVRTKKFPPAA